MQASEIYQAFVKLTDMQKASIIEKAEREGIDEDTLKGLKWLAALSSQKFQDKILSQLYADEAYSKLVA